MLTLIGKCRPLGVGMGLPVLDRRQDAGKGLVDVDLGRQLTQLAGHLGQAFFLEVRGLTQELGLALGASGSKLGLEVEGDVGDEQRLETRSESVEKLEHARLLCLVESEQEGRDNNVASLQCTGLGT
ncbi:MAG: hypothetical protein AB7K24_16280 [Gemmataceae bacterium]